MLEVNAKDKGSDREEKIVAKNELEQYSYTLKRQLEDKEQLGGKISEEDKEKITEIVSEKIEWLRENDEASAEEFKAAKKEIEDIAQPIIVSLYQNGNSEDPSSDEGSHAEDEL